MPRGGQPRMCPSTGLRPQPSSPRPSVTGLINVVVVAFLRNSRKNALAKDARTNFSRSKSPLIFSDFGFAIPVDTNFLKSSIKV